MPEINKSKQMKMAAAEKALEFVHNGMKIGIGTGSTAEEFIRLLAFQVADGLEVITVSTSARTAYLCQQCKIPVSNLDEVGMLDLVIDGADEIGPDLTVMKGGGGALLFEKIVASAANRLLIIADQSKMVDQLGAFPLPIEVCPFGVMMTASAIAKTIKTLGLVGQPKLRMTQKNELKEGEPFITDGGHYIVDIELTSIPDPETLSHNLLSIPGVVEHGLFLNMVSRVIVAYEDGSLRIVER